MSKTSIELDVPTNVAERVRQQDEWRDLSRVLDGLLALESGARMQATCAASSTLAQHAKYMADFYGSAAAVLANIKEQRSIAPAHRATVPIVTVQKIATAIIERVCTLNLVDVKHPKAMLWTLNVTGEDLHRLIMEEFDAELG